MRQHKEPKRTWILFVIALFGIAVMLYAVSLSTRPYTQADGGFSDMKAKWKQWYAQRHPAEIVSQCHGICQEAGIGGGKEGKACNAVCLKVLNEGKSCKHLCNQLSKQGAGICNSRLCPLLVPTATPTPTLTPTPTQIP